MGKKYIIELEDKPLCVFDEDTHTYFPRLRRVKGFNSLVFDQNGLNNLTPYTEPDMEQVRKEAYDKGYENGFVAGHLKAEKSGQSFYEDGYKRGLSDAWEAARKIGSNSMCSLKEMGFDFSQCAVSDYNPSWFVVKNYSASECIEKIRQYEQEKEEQIQVGDEVINQNKTAVVTEITNRYTRIMYSDGSGYALFAKGLTKTGRHFPEIAEVLQKMKES